MKNTLKKVLCTALAAVSLSAMVTVPSSLNKPNSDNSFVNVIEADAAKKERCVDYKLYYAAKKGNIRKSASLHADVINKFNQGVFFIGYSETNNFINIAPRAVDSNTIELKKKKGYIYTKGGHLNNDACFFTVNISQTTKKEPYSSAVNDHYYCPSGSAITIQKVTLEECENGYKMWGYFEARNANNKLEGHWICMMGAEGAAENHPYVTAFSSSLQDELTNMKHTAKKHYITKK